MLFEQYDINDNFFYGTTVLQNRPFGLKDIIT